MLSIHSFNIYTPISKIEFRSRDVHYQDLSSDKSFESILKKIRAWFLRHRNLFPATKGDEGKVHLADIRLCSKNRSDGRQKCIYFANRAIIYLYSDAYRQGSFR